MAIIIRWFFLFKLMSVSSQSATMEHVLLMLLVMMVIGAPAMLVTLENIVILVTFTKENQYIPSCV